MGYASALDCCLAKAIFLFNVLIKTSSVNYLTKLALERYFYDEQQSCKNVLGIKYCLHCWTRTLSQLAHYDYGEEIKPYVRFHPVMSMALPP